MNLCASDCIVCSFVSNSTSANVCHVFQDVDEAHYAYSFKYLKNKPVKELSGDQFLKMCLAEEEGLLAIDICIDLVGVKGYRCVLRILA